MLDEAARKGGERGGERLRADLAGAALDADQLGAAGEHLGRAAFVGHDMRALVAEDGAPGRA